MPVRHAGECALSAPLTNAVSLYWRPMPKPKRPRAPKRQRPPDLVNRLCAAVEELTAQRTARSLGMRFMVHSVARHMGITDEQADAVVAEALA